MTGRPRRHGLIITVARSDYTVDSDTFKFLGHGPGESDIMAEVESGAIARFRVSFPVRSSSTDSGGTEPWPGATARWLGA